MAIDLLTCIPGELAENADLDQLLAAVRAIESWQERQAQVLDYIYRFRLIRAIARRAPADQLRALNAHLARVAHPRRQAALDTLDAPYFARWNTYRQILEDRLAVLDSDIPQRLLARSRVAEILDLVAAKPEGVTQQTIKSRLSLGAANLTRILAMMEANELIERRKIGRENRLLPGVNAESALAKRRAIAEPAGGYHAQAGAGQSLNKRGSAYLQLAPAAHAA